MSYVIFISVIIIAIIFSSSILPLYIQRVWDLPKTKPVNSKGKPDSKSRFSVSKSRLLLGKKLRP